MESRTFNASKLDTFPESNSELIRWAKTYPRPSTAQKKMKSSRRAISVEYPRKDSGYSSSGDGSEMKNRSLSEFSSPSYNPSTLLMNPLNFEVTDVANTPLSSLRSCSEFNKPGSYHGIKRKNSNRPGDGNIHKSIFSRMYAWTFKNSSSSTRVNTSTLKKEEQIFLVEQLRFRPPTDDDNAFSLFYSAYTSTQTNESVTNINSHGASKHVITTAYYDDDGDIDEYRKHSNKRSFMSESSIAVDYVFGFGSSQPKAPKEIELREFSRTTVTNTAPSMTTRNSMRELSAIDSDDEDDYVFELTTFDRESVTELNSMPSPIHQAVVLDSPIQQPTIKDSILHFVYSNLHRFADFSRTYIIGREDDFFYETVRLQPFTAGAYLRGMLLAGFTNFFFTTYGLALWPVHPDSVVLTSVHITYEKIVYTLLWSQFICNLIQLPLRLRIHYACWVTTRAIDVDSAIVALRAMIQSDFWISNRGISRCIDVLSLFCLCIGEVYIWITPASDPLHPLSVSMCATFLLSIFVRLVVGIMFTFSMHDPQVLSDARRRGLSRLDLDNLPTFVFANNDEVNNCDCPICLSSFDMGEMLISLPCSHKHSFHAACIRQWLQRQNSCPLCQKLV